MNGKILKPSLSDGVWVWVAVLLGVLVGVGVWVGVFDGVAVGVGNGQPPK